jgi:hypothetical protein
VRGQQIVAELQLVRCVVMYMACIVNGMLQYSAPCGFYSQAAAAMHLHCATYSCYSPASNANIPLVNSGQTCHMLLCRCPHQHTQQHVTTGQTSSAQ